jgi:ferritin
MLNKRLEKALNEQVNAELWSGYLYLSMAAYCESSNLVGIAHWMTVQAKEELSHATRIYRHIVDRSGRVTLAPIDKVPTTWTSPLQAFEDAYKHEVKVTGLINNLANLAAKENDHATSVMLHWFHTEQIEEEAQTQLIVSKLNLIGKSGGGLLQLDHELGKRKDD